MQSVKSLFFLLLYVVAVLIACSLIKTVRETSAYYGKVHNNIYGGSSKFLVTTTNLIPRNDEAVYEVNYGRTYEGAQFDRPVDQALPKVKKYMKPFNVASVRVSHHPVFLTGFDTTHFTEGEGLIQNLNEELGTGNYTLVFYDLGLNDSQTKTMKQYLGLSHGVYKLFDYNKYPQHVKNLFNYAFKPIIIQEAIQEFGFVFWVDTSFRLRHHKVNQLQTLYDQARMERGFTIWQQKRTLYCFVHAGMYEYFNTDVELYKEKEYHGVHGGAIIVYNTQFSHNSIIIPWTTCALTEDCIAPKGSHRKPCHWDAPGDYCCHRYDQAALAIIMLQLFQYDSAKFDAKLLAHYFQKNDVSSSNYLRNFVNKS